MAANGLTFDGSEKLTAVWGEWPSFHDAEVIKLNLWRGDIRPGDLRAVRARVRHECLVSMFEVVLLCQLRIWSRLGCKRIR